MQNKYNCGIYSITSPSGNMYIGSSKNILKRFSEHKNLLKRGSHHSAALQNAWHKYKGNLEFKQLIVCEQTDLLFYEQLFLDNLNPQYNICKIAGNTLGIIASDETKEKLRQAGYKRIQSEDTKEKIRLANKGVKKSPEHITNMANAKRGKKNKPCSEERREKIRVAATGRKASEETKRILREAWVKRRAKN